jgi:hypothetical protein
MLRQVGPLILLAILAGCAGSGGDSTPAAPAAPVPQTCPATLAYVKERLVTPYPQLEEFIGKDALDSTFSKPVEQMITESGGVAASIAGGERHVQEYQAVLEDETQVRAEYKKAGMTDEWIDTYFLSIRDGVTINQAFVDAVKCRQAQLPDQSQPTTAG